MSRKKNERERMQRFPNWKPMHGQRTLTDQNVKDIQMLYKSGRYTVKRLAKIFHCQPKSVSAAIKGEMPESVLKKSLNQMIRDQSKKKKKFRLRRLFDAAKRKETE